MLLKTQLSGEKLQTERGDVVRNVYKAVRGWKAEDERVPHAFCGSRKQETQSSVSDS